MTAFRLQPFPGQDSGGITIRGTIKRTDQHIVLSFCLQGKLDELVLPPETERARRDNLWQATCLEMFWSEEGEKNYRELNLAPSGAWNVYGFSEYRTGMHREAGVAAPMITTARTADTFTLNAELGVATLHGHQPPLRVGISGVLQHRDNRLSYWALAHPAEKPNFHAPQTFLLRI